MNTLKTTACAAAALFAATLGATSILFQNILGHSGLIFILPIYVYLFVVALGTDYNILMIARLRGAPAKLRDVRPELPAKLEAVLLKALAIDPAERFGSMSEMAHALDAAVSTGVLSRLFRR